MSNILPPTSPSEWSVEAHTSPSRAPEQDISFLAQDADILMSEIQSLPKFPSGTQLVRAVEICQSLNKAVWKRTNEDALDHEIFESTDYFSQYNIFRNITTVGSFSVPNESKPWSITIRKQENHTDISLRVDDNTSGEGTSNYESTQARFWNDWIMQWIRSSKWRPLEGNFKEDIETPPRGQHLSSTAGEYLKMMANDLYRQLRIMK